MACCPATPCCRGKRPRAHLKGFGGVIHADGYAGFNELFAGGLIVEAACWAHVRRKFFDVHAATGSAIAKEALDRIGQLYRVEETINGAAPDHPPISDFQLSQGISKNQ